MQMKSSEMRRTARRGVRTTMRTTWIRLLRENHDMEGGARGVGGLGTSSLVGQVIAAGYGRASKLSSDCQSPVPVALHPFYLWYLDTSAYIFIPNSITR